MAEKNIGFEILEDTGTEIVLKRVLKQHSGNKKRNRYKEEIALPKLSVSYFSDEDLQQLQKLAIEISTKIIEEREHEASFIMKLFTAIKRKVK